MHCSQQTPFCVSHSLVAIPVYVKHNIVFQEDSSSGRFDVTVGPKQNMGKTVESIVLTVHMPKVVLNMNLTPNQGTYLFDPVTRVCQFSTLFVLKCSYYGVVPLVVSVLSGKKQYGYYYPLGID